MKDFVKIGIKRKKIHSNHSEVPELFQKNVLEIIESFTKTVVKRKIFHPNHSEDRVLFQKNVLGIIESFTKRLLSEKIFRQTIVKWLRFQKNCPWYYVDNFFIEVAKTLPL